MLSALYSLCLVGYVAPWSRIALGADEWIRQTLAEPAGIGFPLLAGAIFAGALLFFWLRQRLERLRHRMADRFAERERTTRELYDTLLQDFQGLILQFQTATDQVREGEPGRDMLEDTLRTSDRLMEESREHALTLGSCPIVGDELSVSLGAVGAELQRTSTSGYRVIVHGRARELNSNLRDEVYWIGREALTNAFRHAEADEVEAELFYEVNGLRLCCRDDGLGMSSEAVAADGRRGLMGMLERAQGIGGRLNVWSARNAGTEVELYLPGSLAYRAKETRSYD